jgi:hypothetical protein
MADNAPKRAAKPAANHVALVVCRHSQLYFRLKVKTEMLEKKSIF